MHGWVDGWVDGRARETLQYDQSAPGTETPSHVYCEDQAHPEESSKTSHGANVLTYSLTHGRDLLGNRADRLRHHSCHHSVASSPSASVARVRGQDQGAAQNTWDEDTLPEDPANRVRSPFFSTPTLRIALVTRVVISNNCYYRLRSSYPTDRLQNPHHERQLAPCMACSL